MIRWLSLLLVLLTLLPTGRTLAEGRQRLQVRYEQMKWQEFDEAGRALLEESGPRLGLAWEREPAGILSPGWRFNALAYLGDVDYDGQTQAGQPVESTSEYHGLRGEAAWQVPLPLPGGSVLSPFAGAGGHSWVRSLDDTGGFATTGYDEWWVDVFLTAGIGWRKDIGDGSLAARAGIRHPVYLRAEYDLTLPDGTDDAEVSPESDFAWFAELGFTRGTYAVGLVYEYTSYDTSESKTYGPVILFQPAAEQQVVGLQVGVTF